MKNKLSILYIFLIFANIAFAQNTLTRDERMEWWREARFGMFIHWGIYSVPAGIYNGHEIKHGGAEWIMNRAKIPIAEYQAYAKQFNPVNYNPEAWVKTAKEAGMKYIIITAKHHDGFALFETKASKWNIVDASPYGKDLLKPLAEACRKYGMKLGFYYSQAQDWNNPGGAAARKLTSEGWPNPDSSKIDEYTNKNSGHWDSVQISRSMAEYIDSVSVPQVKELLTEYGKIAVFWWDTPTGMTDEFAQKLQAVLKLQPDIITNDRLKRPNFPGDFKTPEQKIPEQKDVKNGDWESCMTMNGTWGYKSYDNKWKSPQTIISNLIDIASKGGNYLLNVGPKADGEFPEESILCLREVGRWMRVNSEAIYSTKAGPFQQLNWGRSTVKETKQKNILYFFVFDWPADGKLVIPDLKSGVIKVSLMSDGSALATNYSENGLSIYLPSKCPDAIASVIKVELSGELK